MSENASDPAVMAEAAAWLAKLHSEERTGADEQGFQVWLGEDAAHSRAFETLTALWDAAGPIAPLPEVPAPRPHRREMLVGAAVVGVVAVGLAGRSIVGLLAADSYETARGEQKTLTLDDRSRLVLDTGTRVKIAFSEQRRLIELVTGRAHFDVAKDPARPFIVQAGDRQVIATGTAFDVAHEDGMTAVVLVEGGVTVRRVVNRVTADSRIMKAGDRLVFAREAAVHADRPDLAAATAWQSGQAVFDDVPLSEAVATLNRYEQRPIVIMDADVGAMRVSGVYHTGDAAAFARSVTRLLPVSVTDDAKQIRLSKAPTRS